MAIVIDMHVFMQSAFHIRFQMLRSFVGGYLWYQSDVCTCHKPTKITQIWVTNADCINTCISIIIVIVINFCDICVHECMACLFVTVSDCWSRPFLNLSFIVCIYGGSLVIAIQAKIMMVIIIIIMIHV